MLIAHESWFVPVDTIARPVTPDLWRGLATPAHMIVVAAAAVILIVLILEDRRVRRERWRKVYAPFLDYGPTVIGIAAGVGLLMVLFRYGGFFAPHLNYTSGEDAMWYSFFASPFFVFTGAAFISGLFVRPAAFLLLMLYSLLPRILNWYPNGSVLWPMLENLYWIGIALFLLVAGRGRYSLGAYFAKYFPTGKDHLQGPITVVFRVLVGATLIILGLQKIIHPEFHAALLQAYQFNPFEMIRPIAPWFGSALYIFAVAIGEIMIGLAFALGVMLRPLAALLALMFIGSAAFLGPRELIGHLPLIGIFVGFLIMGRDGPATASDR